MFLKEWNRDTVLTSRISESPYSKAAPPTASICCSEWQCCKEDVWGSGWETVAMETSFQKPPQHESGFTTVHSVTQRPPLKEICSHFYVLSEQVLDLRHRRPLSWHLAPCVWLWVGLFQTHKATKQNLSNPLLLLGQKAEKITRLVGKGTLEQTCFLQ